MVYFHLNLKGNHFHTGLVALFQNGIQKHSCWSRIAFSQSWLLWMTAAGTKIKRIRSYITGEYLRNITVMAMKTSLKKKISVLSSLFDNRKKNFHWSVSIYEKFSHYTRAVTATKCSKKCNESMQSCCAHSETMILLFWYSRCHCCCCLSFYSSLFYVGLFLYTVWPWLFVFIIKVE